MEQLLEQLVALTETHPDSMAARQRWVFIRRARRLLSDLLAAEFSDVVVSETVVRDLQASVDGYVDKCVEAVRQALRAHVTPGEHKPAYLRLTHARLIAKPEGRTYRFEIDAGELISPNTFHVNVTIMLVLQALRLIQFIGVRRLQVCDCDRLFVQVGKRRFCSERCQTRVYMRRVRAGEAGKE